VALGWGRPGVLRKEHSEIVETGEGLFLLRDLGSSNGTYVNGERVKGERLLRHGDAIALGETRGYYDDGSSELLLPRVCSIPQG
jgi:adenylate cyclase